MLPFECYTPGVGNFCGTGSFGVADPVGVELTTTLQRPGRFKAMARKHRRWGASGFVQVGEPEAARPVPRNGAA